jgi:3-oxoacyl-[acyl-carrier protein] reductase
MAFDRADFSMISPGRVVVTGASGGIGRATAEKLSNSGLDLILCVKKIDPHMVHWVNSLQEQTSTQISLVEFDFQQEEQVKDQGKYIASEYEISGLVNCAGVGFGAKILMTRVVEAKRIFDINFFNQVIFTQYIVKKMVSQGRGSVVNIASKSAVESHAGTFAYGGSKASLIHFSRVLAGEVSDKGVRINVISPGAVQTKMLDEMEPRAKQKLIASSGMKRPAAPQEIGNVVLFLLSNFSSYISGQSINVDGGNFDGS